MQVLAITTAGYVVMVGFWMWKMEDYLEKRERDASGVTDGTGTDGGR